MKALKSTIFTIFVLTTLVFTNSLTLTNVDTAAGTLDVHMINTEPVSGIQLSLEGVSITGASGGSATDAGFVISTSSSTVLGFSFTGASIPAGDGVLVNVEYTGFVDEICLSGVVMADVSGAAIDFDLGDCYSVTFGCMD